MSEAIGAIILSPRLVATGDPAGKALENLGTDILGDGTLVYVQSGPGKGEWQLDKSATDAPNGTTIVAPTAGPGRWFRKLGPGVPSGTPDNTYPTMADLRAVAPVDDSVVQTYGYADVSDDGGGWWVGVTGSAPGTYTQNGGTVVVPAGGDGSSAWVRLYQEAIDIRWFGASASAADNAPAIQATFDHAESIGGAEVYVPAGEFRCLNYITVGSGVSVAGGGVSSIIFNDGDNLPVFVVLGDGTSFSSVHIKGNNTGIGGASAYVGGDGVAVAGNRCVIDRCRFSGIGAGGGSVGSACAVFGTLFGEHLTVTNCFFDETIASGTGADILSVSRYLLVDGNQSVSKSDQFCNVRDTSDSKHIITNNHVVRTDEAAESRHGILLSYTGEALETIVAGNYIEGTVWTGVYFTSSKPPPATNGNAVISNNIFKNVGGAASGVSSGLNGCIYLFGLNRFTVTGNLVLDSGVAPSGLPRVTMCDGLRLSSCRWGSVVGNTVRGSTGANISAFGTDTPLRDVTISNNTLVGALGVADLILEAQNDPTVSGLGVENAVVSGNTIHTTTDAGVGILMRSVNNPGQVVAQVGVLVSGNTLSSESSVNSHGIRISVRSVFQASKILENIVRGYHHGIRMEGAGLARSGSILLDSNTTISCDVGVITTSGQAIALNHTDSGSAAAYGPDAFGTTVSESSEPYHNAQTGTSYTFVELDQFAEKISFTNASPISATVPDDASLDFPIGTKLSVYAGGTGKVTFAGESAATIESADGFLSLRTQGSAGELWKRGPDDWVLIGDLTA